MTHNRTEADGISVVAPWMIVTVMMAIASLLFVSLAPHLGYAVFIVPVLCLISWAMATFVFMGVIGDTSPNLRALLMSSSLLLATIFVAVPALATSPWRDAFPLLLGVSLTAYMVSVFWCLSMSFTERNLSPADLRNHLESQYRQARAERRWFRMGLYASVWPLMLLAVAYIPVGLLAFFIR